MISKIHQIWITDNNTPPGEYVQAQMAKLNQMYPDCEYTLYNQTTLFDFIMKNFDSDVGLAFQKIKPYAFKADLGRYCLLYVHGGYYFDAALCPKFRYQHNDYAFILQGETVILNGEPCSVLDNGIMYFSETMNAFLKSAIEKSVENILRHNYGRSPLDVTGPSMLAGLDHSMIKKFPYSVVNNKKVTCIDEQIWFEYQHGFSAAPIGTNNSWDENLVISKSEARGTNSYSLMWHNRDVFKGKPVK